MPSPWRRWVPLAALLIAGLAGAAAPAQQVQTATVTAGFVYNFAKFTTWPAGALPAEDSVVRLCLTGNDPGNAFAEALAGKPLQGRVLGVQALVAPTDLATCHIAFLNNRDERHQAEALRAVRGLPVLTVGDTDGFVDLGGDIGLVNVGGRLQFDVNVTTAHGSGLEISSQLLQLARRTWAR